MDRRTETILQALYDEGLKFRSDAFKNRPVNAVVSNSIPLVVAEQGSFMSLDDYAREVKGGNLYFDAIKEPIFIYKPEADMMSLVQNGQEHKR